jgi:DNA polymerase III epsilon subunit-like protein
MPRARLKCALPRAPANEPHAEVHGIWDRDVEDAPEVEDVADDLLTWLEDKPIVGHNVRVELGILTDALEGWEPTAAYDTLKLARRLLPDQPKAYEAYRGHPWRMHVRVMNARENAAAAAVRLVSSDAIA